MIRMGLEDIAFKTIGEPCWELLLGPPVAPYNP